jgi:hypothetical protein
MGIGDWFKRFKQNAAGFEETREGMIQPDEGAGPSQAERAARDRQAASESTSASGESGGGDGADGSS